MRLEFSYDIHPALVGRHVNCGLPRRPLTIYGLFAPLRSIRRRERRMSRKIYPDHAASHKATDQLVMPQNIGEIAAKALVNVKITNIGIAVELFLNLHR